MSEVSLRDYFERRLEEYDRLIQNQFVALDKALALAHTDLNRRLVDLNELRREVTSDRGLLMTREKFDAEMKNLLSRLTLVESAFISKEKHEADHRAHGQRLAAMERWKSSVVGGLLVASLAISIAVALIVRAFL